MVPSYGTCIKLTLFSKNNWHIQMSRTFGRCLTDSFMKGDGKFSILTQTDHSSVQGLRKNKSINVILVLTNSP